GAARRRPRRRSCATFRGAEPARRGSVEEFRDRPPLPHQRPAVRCNAPALATADRETRDDAARMKADNLPTAWPMLLIRLETPQRCKNRVKNHPSRCLLFACRITSQFAPLVGILAVALASSAACTSQSAASSPAGYFRGKTVHVIVSYAAGGG